MHFSEECLGWTVTESPNPVQRFEGGLWLGCARLGAQKDAGRFNEAGFQLLSFSFSNETTRWYVCLAGDGKVTG